MGTGAEGLPVSDDRLRHTVMVTPRPWKWVVQCVAEHGFIAAVVLLNLRAAWEEISAADMPVWMVTVALPLSVVLLYFWARLWLWLAKCVFRVIRYISRRVRDERKEREVAARNGDRFAFAGLFVMGWAALLNWLGVPLEWTARLSLPLGLGTAGLLLVWGESRRANTTRTPPAREDGNQDTEERH